MPRIKLLTVQCMVPDEIDKDEMYLKYNGLKIWPKGDLYWRIDSGEKAEINVELDLPEGWVKIALWDFDFISPNDHLGDFDFEVSSALPGKYSTSMHITEKDSTASYILSWEVLGEY